MDLQSLIMHFTENPALLFFIAAVVGGEEVIVPLAFLVGRGWWDMPTLFIFSFLGTIVSDGLWFLLGRHGIQNTPLFKKHANKYGTVKKLIRKIAQHDFNLLLITKFIYGTRIFTIIHLSLEKTPFLRFLGLNSIVIFIWLCVILSIGWFAGTGSRLFSNLYEHPGVLVLSLLGTIILFHIFRNFLGKKLTKTTLEQ